MLSRAAGWSFNEAVEDRSDREKAKHQSETARSDLRKPVHLIPSIITLALLISASAGGLGSQTMAQSNDIRWTAPVNISRSGAASELVLIAGPEGMLQAFWWDQFDGVMTATYDGEAWSRATQASIIVVSVVGEGAGGRTVSTPVEEMPSMGGGSRYAHALWRGEPDEETDIIPLMHSRLALGTDDWSTPRAIGDSALVWRMTSAPSGALHLIYVRGQQSDALPAGIYHMRSTDGGSRWSAPHLLYESAYVRLLDPEQTHLWVTTGAEGEVCAAWDDPRLERTFLARSLDDGASWGAAQVIGDPDDGARRARVIPAQGEPLLLWEASQATTGCALYQQRLAMVTEVATATQTLSTAWSTPGPEDLRTCPDVLTVHRREEDHPILIMGSGSGSLTAVAWNGAQWSQPKSLSFSFEDSELGQQVYLEALQTALVDGELAVLGLGQDGDVWYLESEVEAWEWAFAPPSPWSEPVNVSHSEGVSQSGGVPGRPAVAVDAEGQVHLLWSETPADGGAESALYYAGQSQDRWSRPALVLESPEGKAEEPTLVAVGDRLHALWSGGWSGEIYHSWAYVRDAYAPEGWSEPRALPMAGTTGSLPDLLIDAHGTLHVVYAVPLNEGRGIAYVRSDDGGETWSEPQVVFDAEAAGWAMADHPTLAMDPAGTLHVAWVQGSQDGHFPPQGIFYARSTDGGGTWSEQMVMAEGTYDWPRITAPLPGQAHLLWNEITGGGGWTHRWSADYGASWSTQQQVRGFRDVPGPIGLTADGAGTLHLVGLGQDGAGEPALVYTIWSAGDETLAPGAEGSWGELETFRLEHVEDAVPGAAVALAGAQGRLNVAFRAEVESEGGPKEAVFYVDRSVPTVDAGPEPSYTPMPTVTPTPSPTPTPRPTPRPTVSAQPPEAGPPALSLGPITLPMTALGGLGVATLIVVGVLVGQGLWAGRR